jgi:hypothetical protein
MKHQRSDEILHRASFDVFACVCCVFAEPLAL